MAEIGGEGKRQNWHKSSPKAQYFPVVKVVIAKVNSHSVVTLSVFFFSSSKKDQVESSV